MSNVIPFTAPTARTLILPKQEYTGTHIYLCSFTTNKHGSVVHSGFVTTTKSIRRSIREQMLPIGDLYKGLSKKENISHHKGPLVMLGRIFNDLTQVLQKTTQKRYIPEINIYLQHGRHFTAHYVKEIKQNVHRRYTKQFVGMSIDNYINQVEQTVLLRRYKHTDLISSIVTTILEGLEQGQASNVRMRINPQNKKTNKVSRAIMSYQIKLVANTLYNL